MNLQHTIVLCQKSLIIRLELNLDT